MSLKDCLIDFSSKEYAKDITFIIHEKSGYGYSLDDPIELATPNLQINFILTTAPKTANTESCTLFNFERVGSFKCDSRNGPTDMYEVAYSHIQDGKEIVEYYVLYFSMYNKKNEAYTNFLARIMTSETPIPEGLKKIKYSNKVIKYHL